MSLLTEKQYMGEASPSSDLLEIDRVGEADRKFNGLSDLKAEEVAEELTEVTPVAECAQTSRSGLRTALNLPFNKL